MALQAYKPTTPGRRGMTSQDFDGITTRKPLRSLLVTKIAAMDAITRVALLLVIKVAALRNSIV
jgi:ribosomal protein L2